MGHRTGVGNWGTLGVRRRSRENVEDYIGDGRLDLWDLLQKE